MVDTVNISQLRRLPVVESKPKPEPAAGVSVPLVNSQEANGKDLPPQEEKASPEVTKGEVNDAVQQLNDHVQNLRRELQFSINESTGATVIHVFNSETGELVRSIPPEEALELANQLDAEKGGALVNIRA